MSGGALIVQRTGAVCVAVLDNPTARNALSESILAGLELLVDGLQGDSGTRCLVVTGSGSAFCAGADLTRLAGGGDPELPEIVAYVERVSLVFEGIANLPFPTIAAVNGVAVAGGLELALACDVVLAARSARLGDGHARYGLMPGAGGAPRLVAAAGGSIARYLMLTGELVSAQRMAELGLVHELVDDDQLEARAMVLAGTMAGHSASGLARMKSLLADCGAAGVADGLRLEQYAFATHALSSDFREGLSAFAEKRQPNFHVTR